MKAHDVFPAVCYPDLFWKLAKEDIDAEWALLCPDEVLTVKGYALEDYTGAEWERRYRDCGRTRASPNVMVTVKGTGAPSSSDPP